MTRVFGGLFADNAIFPARKQVPSLRRVPLQLRRRGFPDSRFDFKPSEFFEPEPDVVIVFGRHVTDDQLSMEGSRAGINVIGGLGIGEPQIGIRRDQSLAKSSSATRCG